MIRRRKPSAWARTVLAVLALLFASSPVLAWETPTTTMAMAMAPADESGTNAPCDPVKMTCARLCAVLCHALAPTPAADVQMTVPTSLPYRWAAEPLAGIDPESEDPPPRA